jgi:hypothetical protein
MAIAYFQPITRGELSQFLGREVSRDAIAALREEDLIAAGPRSPTPGAPYAYATTPEFFWRNSGSKVCGICRISKNSKTLGCLGGRARTRLAAMCWRPSCEACWD